MLEARLQTSYQGAQNGTAPYSDEWGIAERGRVTKGTAEGLLAKVYLFRQDYASVKQYAGQVISRDALFL